MKVRSSRIDKQLQQILDEYLLGPISNYQEDYKVFEAKFLKYKQYLPCTVKSLSRNKTYMFYVVDNGNILHISI